MKAPIESALRLEEVGEHFEQWRKGKKKGERIPEELWGEAIGLLGRYGVSQVTQALRLSGSDLNRRRGILGSDKRRQGAGGQRAFVEVERALVDQAVVRAAPAVWMELERPDGLRLRIQPSNGAEVLALVDRFLGV